MKLKSIITLIIVMAFSFAFCYTVIKFLDTETAKAIITSFLTVATSVIGFFIGYQTNKKDTK